MGHTGDYDASVDLYSFGVLMVELLFRDVEACIDTARRMETAQRQEGEIQIIQLQLQTALRKQRRLLTSDGAADQAEEDDEEEQQQSKARGTHGGVSSSDAWRDSDPATSSIPWRGLRLILTEQLRMHVHVHVQRPDQQAAAAVAAAAAATIRESKRRTLALAEQCCAPSAAERPTAAEAAAELETISRLANAPANVATAAPAVAGSAGRTTQRGRDRRRQRWQHTTQLNTLIDSDDDDDASSDSSSGDSGGHGGSGGDGVPPPLVQYRDRVPPPYDSDSDGDASESSPGPPSHTLQQLQRTLSAQSARVAEARARSEAERLLEREQAEQAELDRSIESVRSEHEAMLQGQGQQAQEQQAQEEQESSPTCARNDGDDGGGAEPPPLPRSMSGEYVPAAWWASEE